MNKLESRKGFTVIELLAAITVVGILLAIAIPAFSNCSERARVSGCTSLAAPAQLAVNNWVMRTGRTPGCFGEVGFEFGGTDGGSGGEDDDDRGPRGRRC